MLGIEGIDYKAAVETYERQVDEADQGYDEGYMAAWDVWYEATKDSADRYNKALDALDQKYPGWQNFGMSINLDAEQEFSSVRRTYFMETKPATEVRDRACRENSEHFHQALANARDTLLTTVAADPFAIWLVAEARGAHPGEVMQVLSLLPASLARIDRLAQANEWCGAYDRLRRVAIRLKLIPEKDLVEVGERGMWC